jgi:hypothetical protein
MWRSRPLALTKTRVNPIIECIAEKDIPMITALLLLLAVVAIVGSGYVTSRTIDRLH